MAGDVLIPFLDLTGDVYTLAGVGVRAFYTTALTVSSHRSTDPLGRCRWLLLRNNQVAKGALQYMNQNGNGTYRMVIAFTFLPTFCWFMPRSAYPHTKETVHRSVAIYVAMLVCVCAQTRLKWRRALHTKLH